MNCPICGAAGGRCSFLHKLEREMASQSGGKMAEKKWGPSPKEYGLDKDGNLCETDDPKVKSLLVAKDGYLPVSVAAKHGLIETPAPPPPPESGGTTDNVKRAAKPLDLRKQGGKAKVKSKR
jgi:hypothetical protein